MIQLRKQVEELICSKLNWGSRVYTALEDPLYTQLVWFEWRKSSFGGSEFDHLQRAFTSYHLFLQPYVFNHLVTVVALSLIFTAFLQQKVVTLCMSQSLYYAYNNLKFKSSVAQKMIS